jgi:hypothetical protein
MTWEKLQKHIHIPLWIGWILFVLWVSYKCRFWINDDTIGSLDSARFLKEFKIVGAINAYWGVGYAAILSFIPLTGAKSWFYLHLCIAVLILLAQFFIYQSLIIMKIRKLLATFICIIWGASNYATGGAIFVTADVPLCLVGSIFLMIVVKQRTFVNIMNMKNGLILGLLHGLSWLTKMAALPALLIFPLIIFLKSVYNALRSKCFDLEIKRSIIFLMSYFIPLLILILLWNLGCQAKYGRYTLGTTALFNYVAFVDRSESLDKATDLARHNIPLWGTYWWSDISINLTGWDFTMHYNLNKQLNRIKFNITYAFSDRELITGIIDMLIILTALIYIIIIFIKNKENEIWVFLPLLSLNILLMYLCSNFFSRYYPFAALFSLPAISELIERFLHGSGKLLKKMAQIFLLGALMHGIAAMAYASLVLAPGGEHFAIAELIRQQNRGTDLYGPIGYFDSVRYFDSVHGWFHHGRIAFLLGAQTAEIRKIAGDCCNFSATFEPKNILIVSKKAEKIAEMVRVDSRWFRNIGSYSSRGSDQITVYKPTQ